MTRTEHRSRRVVNQRDLSLPERGQSVLRSIHGSRYFLSGESGGASLHAIGQLLIFLQSRSSLLRRSISRSTWFEASRWNSFLPSTPGLKNISGDSGRSL
jgi:hypothetical protein